MPFKLLSALHKTKAKLTKVELSRVVKLWWKGGVIPCLNLMSSNFYECNIFHFGAFFMFPQSGRIKGKVTAILNTKKLAIEI